MLSCHTALVLKVGKKCWEDVVHIHSTGVRGGGGGGGAQEGVFSHRGIFLEVG